MGKKNNINILSGIGFVLQDTRYLGILLISTLAMYLFLSISMQILLLNPVLFWNWGKIIGNEMLLEGKLFYFVTPILFGLAFTLTVYRVKELKMSLGKESPLTTIGLIASLFTPGCSVCLPLVLSFFGIGYAFFNSAIAPLILPIQIIVYSLLLISIYFLSKDICIKCFIKKKRRIE